MKCVVHCLGLCSVCIAIEQGGKILFSFSQPLISILLLLDNIMHAFHFVLLCKADYNVVIDFVIRSMISAQPIIYLTLFHNQLFYYRVIKGFINAARSRCVIGV